MQSQNAFASARAVLEGRHKAAVLAFLKTARRVSRALLQEQINASEAAFAQALSALEEARHIKVKPGRSGTSIGILPAGEAALFAHLDALAGAIEDIDPKP